MSAAKRTRVISFDLGTRSMSFAHVEYPCRILRWGLIDCGVHQARMATRNLVRLLETEHRWMRECGDDVVVELQPSNGVIKTLSHVLQAYFATVHLADAPHHRFDFMQANNKLKFNLDLYNEVRPTDGKARKVVTMRTVEEHILPQQLTQSFGVYYNAERYKQRTDLADSLVQACRWLQIENDPPLSAKRKREAANVHHPTHYGKGDFCLAEATRADMTVDLDEIEFLDD